MYNNGYNNNNYNNQVVDVLNNINELIIRGRNGKITTDEILGNIKLMAQHGVISVIGEGTNRIAVEINGDISPYIGFNGPAIIKIPYAINKGLDDNLRELFLVEFLNNIYRNTGDQDLLWLLQRLPQVSSVQGYPYLVAQEKIVPIDKWNEVGSSATRDNQSVAAVCTSYILDKHMYDQAKLLSVLDKYTVYADLNPVTTPFQYGMKNVNGTPVLTILDTGYVIPKFMEYEQLINEGSLIPRRYFVLGRDATLSKIQKDGAYIYNITSNDESFISKATLNILVPVLYGQCGVYVATTPVSDSDKIVNDIAYFMEYNRLISNYASNNPWSDSGRYFIELRNRKSQ